MSATTCNTFLQLDATQSQQDSGRRVSRWTLTYVLWRELPASSCKKNEDGAFTGSVLSALKSFAWATLTTASGLNQESFSIQATAEVPNTIPGAQTGVRG